MNRSPGITSDRRAAFSALIRSARTRKGLSYDDLADAVAINGDVIPWTWFQWLELGCNKGDPGPATPLRNPDRLNQAIRELDLTWRDVLDALGLWEIARDPDELAGGI